jgi:hypothetical protein
VADENPAPSDTAITIPDLNQDRLLQDLARPSITATEISAIAKSATATKSAKVALAIILHPRTPTHIAIPLLRRMFTFDAMKVSLTPALAGSIKRAAEDQILVRLESLSSGEKISLAKRASGRVASALLQEPDERIISPALDNPRMTEALVFQALVKAQAPEALFRIVSASPKWAAQREVCVALVRSPKTPLERAKEFARSFSKEFLQEIVPPERARDLIPD